MSKTNTEKVREVLLEHVGRESAITSTEIGEEVDIPNGNGNSNVRSSVRELAMDVDEPPIAACNDGYFVISSYDELREYTSVLEKRRRKLDDRRSNTQHSFFNYWVNKEQG